MFEKCRVILQYRSHRLRCFKRPTFQNFLQTMKVFQFRGKSWVFTPVKLIALKRIKRKHLYWRRLMLLHVVLYELCKILSSHCIPPAIIFREWKNFFSSVKNERVKGLALNCRFGNNFEAFVLNQFTIHLLSKPFERLCEENETLIVAEA